MPVQGAAPGHEPQRLLALVGEGAVHLIARPREDLFVKHSVLTSAEKAEPSEIPGHNYDGTPTTA